MKPFDKYQDIEQGGYAKFTGLKTYNKQLKTMIAIGGWNEASSRFSPLVANPERRQKFIKNILKFLRQNHFDGIDLDWEYPAHREGGKPGDRDNYAQFVQELRAEFERESEKTGRQRLLLTMAVPAGIEYIEKGYDIPKLNKYLDWFNVLTYDFHSSHEPSVNHHAPLYPLEEDSEYNYDAELNIDYSIKFYLKAGADRNKLILGIPTYGRSYTLINEESTEIGAPAEGPGEQGDATREKGYLAYYEICNNIKEDPDWEVVQPNPNAMGPYAYRRTQWVGYDDEAIVRKKAQYVVEHGLGGIMFWSIDNDDFRGTCTGKSYPLIEAAKESMFDALGLGINEVSKSNAPRKSNRSRNNENSVATRNRINIGEKLTYEKRKESSRRTSNPETRKRLQHITTKTPSSTTIRLTEAEGSSLYIGGRTTTPPPPTTPDPGTDFKCEDEGFYQHPRDCKKYYWCLDSGPSGLGIVAHQFTCPSGLYFNPAADSCDFARNVPCKTKKSTTAAPVTKPYVNTSVATTAKPTASETRITAATARTTFFRTTSTTKHTTPTTVKTPAEEKDYVDVEEQHSEEDPKVIKELIELIRRVGGIEELEKHLLRKDDGTISFKQHSSSSSNYDESTTSSSISKSLYDKVLSRPNALNSLRNRFTPSNSYQKTGQLDGAKSDEETEVTSENDTNNSRPTSEYSKYSSVVRGNSRQGPQNEGLDKLPEFAGFLKERKQYVTINRNRGSQKKIESVESDEEETAAIFKSEEITEKHFSGTTPSYTSIRRTRPSTTVSLIKEENFKDTTISKPHASLSRMGNKHANSAEASVTEDLTLIKYKYLERARSNTEDSQGDKVIENRKSEKKDADIIHQKEDQKFTVQLSAAKADYSTQQLQEQVTTIPVTQRTYTSLGRRTTTTASNTETSTPVVLVTTTPTETSTAAPNNIENLTYQPLIALTTIATTTTNQPVTITNTSPSVTIIPSITNDLISSSNVVKQEIQLSESTLPSSPIRDSIATTLTTQFNLHSIKHEIDSAVTAATIEKLSTPTIPGLTDNKDEVNLVIRDQNQSTVYNSIMRDTAPIIKNTLTTTTEKHISFTNRNNTDSLNSPNTAYKYFGGKRDKDQQKVLSRSSLKQTTEMYPITTTITNESINNEFLGSVSSPRPFGYPKRRGRPTVSSTTTLATEVTSVKTQTKERPSFVQKAKLNAAVTPQTKVSSNIDYLSQNYEMNPLGKELHNQDLSTTIRSLDNLQYSSKEKPVLGDAIVEQEIGLEVDNEKKHLVDSKTNENGLNVVEKANGNLIRQRNQTSKNTSIKADRIETKYLSVNRSSITYITRNHTINNQEQLFTLADQDNKNFENQNKKAFNNENNSDPASMTENNKISENNESGLQVTENESNTKKQIRTKKVFVESVESQILKPFMEEKATTNETYKINYAEQVPTTSNELLSDGQMGSENDSSNERHIGNNNENSTLLKDINLTITTAPLAYTRNASAQLDEENITVKSVHIEVNENNSHETSTYNDMLGEPINIKNVATKAEPVMTERDNSLQTAGSATELDSSRSFSEFNNEHSEDISFSGEELKLLNPTMDTISASGEKESIGFSNRLKTNEERFTGSVLNIIRRGQKNRERVTSTQGGQELQVEISQNPRSLLNEKFQAQQSHELEYTGTRVNAKIDKISDFPIQVPDGNKKSNNSENQFGINGQKLLNSDVDTVKSNTNMKYDTSENVALTSLIANKDNQRSIKNEMNTTSKSEDYKRTKTNEERNVSNLSLNSQRRSNDQTKYNFNRQDSRKKFIRRKNSEQTRHSETAADNERITVNKLEGSIQNPSINESNNKHKKILRQPYRNRNAIANDSKERNQNLQQSSSNQVSNSIAADPVVKRKFLRSRNQNISNKTEEIEKLANGTTIIRTIYIDTVSTGPNTIKMRKRIKTKVLQKQEPEYEDEKESIEVSQRSIISNRGAAKFRSSDLSSILALDLSFKAQKRREDEQRTRRKFLRRPVIISETEDIEEFETELTPDPTFLENSMKSLKTSTTDPLAVSSMQLLLSHNKTPNLRNFSTIKSKTNSKNSETVQHFDLNRLITTPKTNAAVSTVTELLPTPIEILIDKQDEVERSIKEVESEVFDAIVNGEDTISDSHGHSNFDDLSLPVYHRRKYYQYYKDSPVAYVNPTISSAAIIENTPPNIAKQIHDVFNISANQLEADISSKAAAESSNVEEERQITKEYNHFLMTVPRPTKVKIFEENTTRYNIEEIDIGNHSNTLLQNLVICNNTNNPTTRKLSTSVHEPNKIINVTDQSNLTNLVTKNSTAPKFAASIESSREVKEDIFTNLFNVSEGKHILNHLNNTKSSEKYNNSRLTHPDAKRLHPSRISGIREETKSNFDNAFIKDRESNLKVSIQSNDSNPQQPTIKFESRMNLQIDPLLNATHVKSHDAPVFERNLTETIENENSKQKRIESFERNSEFSVKITKVDDVNENDDNSVEISTVQPFTTDAPGFRENFTDTSRLRQLFENIDRSKTNRGVLASIKKIKDFSNKVKIEEKAVNLSTISPGTTKIFRKKGDAENLDEFITLTSEHPVTTTEAQSFVEAVAPEIKNVTNKVETVEKDVHSSLISTGTTKVFRKLEDVENTSDFITTTTQHPVTTTESQTFVEVVTVAPGLQKLFEAIKGAIVSKANSSEYEYNRSAEEEVQEEDHSSIFSPERIKQVSEDLYLRAAPSLSLVTDGRNTADEETTATLRSLFAEHEDQNTTEDPYNQEAILLYADDANPSEGLIDTSSKELESKLRVSISPSHKNVQQPAFNYTSIVNLEVDDFENKPDVKFHDSSVFGFQRNLTESIEYEEPKEKKIEGLSKNSEFSSTTTADSINENVDDATEFTTVQTDQAFTTTASHFRDTFTGTSRLQKLYETIDRSKNNQNILKSIRGVKNFKNKVEIEEKDVNSSAIPTGTTKMCCKEGDVENSGELITPSTQHPVTITESQSFMAGVTIAPELEALFQAINGPRTSKANSNGHEYNRSNEEMIKTTLAFSFRRPEQLRTKGSEKNHLHLGAAPNTSLVTNEFNTADDGFVTTTLRSLFSEYEDQNTTEDPYNQGAILRDINAAYLSSAHTNTSTKDLESELDVSILPNASIPEKLTFKPISRMNLQVGSSTFHFQKNLNANIEYVESKEKKISDFEQNSEFSITTVAKQELTTVAPNFSDTLTGTSRLRKLYESVNRSKNNQSVLKRIKSVTKDTNKVEIGGKDVKPSATSPGTTKMFRKEENVKNFDEPATSTTQDPVTTTIAQSFVKNVTVSPKLKNFTNKVETGEKDVNISAISVGVSDMLRKNEDVEISKELITSTTQHPSIATESPSFLENITVAPELKKLYEAINRPKISKANLNGTEYKRSAIEEVPEGDKKAAAFSSKRIKQFRPETSGNDDLHVSAVQNGSLATDKVNITKDGLATNTMFSLISERNDESTIEQAAMIDKATEEISTTIGEQQSTIEKKNNGETDETLVYLAQGMVKIDRNDYNNQANSTKLLEKATRKPFELHIKNRMAGKSYEGKRREDKDNDFYADNLSNIYNNTPPTSGMENISAEITLPSHADENYTEYNHNRVKSMLTNKNMFLKLKLNSFKNNSGNENIAYKDDIADKTISSNILSSIPSLDTNHSSTVANYFNKLNTNSRETVYRTNIKNRNHSENRLQWNDFRNDAKVNNTSKHAVTFNNFSEGNVKQGVNFSDNVVVNNDYNVNFKRRFQKYNFNRSRYLTPTITPGVTTTSTTTTEKYSSKESQDSAHVASVKVNYLVDVKQTREMKEYNLESSTIIIPESTTPETLSSPAPTLRRIKILKHRRPLAGLTNNSYLPENVTSARITNTTTANIETQNSDILSTVRQADEKLGTTDIKNLTETNNINQTETFSLNTVTPPKRFRKIIRKIIKPMHITNRPTITIKTTTETASAAVRTIKPFSDQNSTRYDYNRSIKITTNETKSKFDDKEGVNENALDANKKNETLFASEINKLTIHSISPTTYESSSLGGVQLGRYKSNASLVATSKTSLFNDDAYNESDDEKKGSKGENARDNIKHQSGRNRDEEVANKEEREDKEGRQTTNNFMNLELETSTYIPIMYTDEYNQDVSDDSKLRKESNSPDLTTKRSSDIFKARLLGEIDQIETDYDNIDKVKNSEKVFIKNSKTNSTARKTYVSKSVNSRNISRNDHSKIDESEQDKLLKFYKTEENGESIMNAKVEDDVESKVFPNSLKTFDTSTTKNVLNPKANTSLINTNNDGEVLNTDLRKRIKNSKNETRGKGKTSTVQTLQKTILENGNTENYRSYKTHIYHQENSDIKLKDESDFESDTIAPKATVSDEGDSDMDLTNDWNAFNAEILTDPKITLTSEILQSTKKSLLYETTISPATVRPTYRRKVIIKKPSLPITSSTAKISTSDSNKKYLRPSTGRFVPNSANNRKGAQRYVKTDSRAPPDFNISQLKGQDSLKTIPNEEFYRDSEEDSEEIVSKLKSVEKHEEVINVLRPAIAKQIPLLSKSADKSSSINKQVESFEEDDDYDDSNIESEDEDEEDEEEEEEGEGDNEKEEFDDNDGYEGYRKYHENGFSLSQSVSDKSPTSSRPGGNIPFNSRISNTSNRNASKNSYKSPLADTRAISRPRIVNRPQGIAVPHLTIKPVATDFERTTVPVPTKPAPFIPSYTPSYERKYTGPSTDPAPLVENINPFIEDLNVEALNARNKKIFDINSKKHTTLKPKLLIPTVKFSNQTNLESALESQVPNTVQNTAYEVHESYSSSQQSDGGFATTTTPKTLENTMGTNTEDKQHEYHINHDVNANEIFSQDHDNYLGLTTTQPPSTTLLHVFTLSDDEQSTRPSNSGAEVIPRLIFERVRPKHKVIEINRVVEIHSKEEKLRRKSKANQIVPIGVPSTLKVESLPHVEQLGEISVVKYVHLVDGSDIKVEGHSTVTDYTPTESIVQKSSMPVRNSLPEDHESIEGISVNVDENSPETSVIIRVSTSQESMPNIIQKRQGKALVPEVIREAIETSTISLEGLFENARKAKVSNTIDGMQKQIQLSSKNDDAEITMGLISTVSPEISDERNINTPLNVPLTAWLNGSNWEKQEIAVSKNTSILLKNNNTEQKSALSSQFVQEESTTNALNLDNFKVSTVPTTLFPTYVRPIVPLLRPESNESSPLVISIANLDKVILSKVKKTDSPALLTENLHSSIINPSLISKSPQNIHLPNSFATKNNDNTFDTLISDDSRGAFSNRLDSFVKPSVNPTKLPNHTEKKSNPDTPTEMYTILEGSSVGSTTTSSVGSRISEIISYSTETHVIRKKRPRKLNSQST
uniref:chitinase n=1 Tax=Glossina brevipalpis TaxID=37001 RepID=A0A1A9WGP2_9MUSC